ncbi:MAG: hypothetical protein M1832_000551 [Thelocarpon impressellum]|nr:MAG: hypothetical protein M1832_000551 [Thelocarpon impressellum]
MASAPPPPPLQAPGIVPSAALSAQSAAEDRDSLRSRASSSTTATSSAPIPRPLPSRLTLGDGAASEVERRPSIQFAALNRSMDSVRTGSPKPARPSSRRRITFQDRVSFDTFDNKDASDFSLTLNSKHKDYQYTRRSRTFLCGTDQNDYSEFALEWLIDELVDNGDEIVCLRVVDKDAKISSDASVEEGRYRTEAKSLLEQIIEKNRNSEERAISLVLEFAVGKVHDTIQRMIEIYEPAILIVGTRGRSLGGLQGLLPGSVSKYCLQHSPVPVIVVRPTYKREKKKKKRQADPSRKGYMSILEKSGARGGRGGHAVGQSSGKDGGDASGTPGNECEAEAVAAAIGLIPAYDGPGETVSLHRAQSTKSDAASVESPSPTGEVLLDDPRSPGLATKSPGASDSETSDEESDGEGRETAAASAALGEEGGDSTAEAGRATAETSGSGDGHA